VCGMQPLPICASSPNRDVLQTYPMRGDVCCRAGTADCRRRAAGVHFFQTGVRCCLLGHITIAVQKCNSGSAAQCLPSQKSL
jgi:hypothetical protein